MNPYLRSHHGCDAVASIDPNPRLNPAAPPPPPTTAGDMLDLEVERVAQRVLGLLAVPPEHRYQPLVQVVPVQGRRDLVWEARVVRLDRLAGTQVPMIALTPEDNTWRGAMLSSLESCVQRDLGKLRTMLHLLDAPDGAVEQPTETLQEARAEDEESARAWLLAQELARHVEQRYAPGLLRVCYRRVVYTDGTRGRRVRLTAYPRGGAEPVLLYRDGASGLDTLALQLVEWVAANESVLQAVLGQDGLQPAW